MKTEIIYEDQGLLVCRKPAGLATQAAAGFRADMVSELKNYLSRELGKRNPYLGLIHRLDQPVEGLLVCAREKRAAAELSAQLADGRLHKKYIAVLQGVPDQQQGTRTDYLKKDRKTNLSTVVSAQDKEAKRAELSYRLLAQKDGAALAEIEIGSGRHHQIRVQMAHMGYPLRGDSKYGAPQTLKGTGAEDRERYSLALCACSLEFINPITHRRQSFFVRPENPAFAEFSDILV